MTAEPGRPRTLTATAWHGDPPRVGDLVRTPTGTTYLVQDVRTGTTNPYRLTVIRLGERDAETFLADPDAVVHAWQWNKRTRSTTPGAPAPAEDRR